ncbi:hypothetical protein [Rhodobacter ferrooxidans]|uniref:Lipoprotein n=1 Tax=Rhodobacter ferrooxidans TaxID=371731 RepID=C8RZK3_9RHOB|nr:hypothetical protein [Rhodobacter sp. SW2]EEW25800.1 hypothetical protein Rsw2DRAFT_1231 [Rhodobacter sp. SW2]
MTRRGLLATLLAAALATPATAGCLFFCDDAGKPLPADKALASFTADLGAPLPTGVDLLALYEGGFNDRFGQVKLRASLEGRDALLALIVPPGGQFAPLNGQQLEIIKAPGWDPLSHPDLTVAAGRLGRFATTHVALAADPSDPALTLIYITAFET